MKANKQLATYLNNHLTASVTALELLSTLAERKDYPELARFAEELHDEITAEQQQLEALMEGLEITKSKPRQAIGQLAEFFTQIKLRFDDVQDGPLHLLETLELLLIAIEGKRGLWSALAANEVPGLTPAEYEERAQRSKQQQQGVERFRLIAAKAAFSQPSD
jgi:hypothetical protein